MHLQKRIQETLAGLQGYQVGTGILFFYTGSEWFPELIAWDNGLAIHPQK